MDPAAVLRRARQRAGLTQRELAVAAGVAQPTVARIESGREDPRVSTLDRLLRCCGEALLSEVAAGSGIDRTAIRELLAMTAAERLASLAAGSR
ncbi:MAG: helix-turn-helix domain-containing protein [Actinomycetota bacterium]